MEGEIEKSKEELELEKVVFGDFSAFDDAFQADDGEAEFLQSDEESDTNPVPDDELFFVDKGRDENSGDDDLEMDSASARDSSEEAAWMDSDDDEITVSLTAAARLRKLRHNQAETQISGREYEKRLRSQFQKLFPQPVWASRNAKGTDKSETSDGESDSYDPTGVRTAALADVLSRITDYSKPNSALKLLPTTELDISRLQDITRQQASQSAIQTLEFHPQSPLVLTGGYDQTLRIYHVDGKINPVATSLHIRGSPVQTAAFHADGRRVFAGGRRKYFYIWDLEYGSVDKVTRVYGHEQTQRSMEKFVLSPDGQYVGLVGSNGWLNVMSAVNGQWITGAKIDGSIADLVWSNDGNVTIASREGDIYDWDARTRSFSNRWKDQAGVNVTKIAQTERWCAVGAANGMVNVYDRTNPKFSSSISNFEPTVWDPKFVVDNLVTTVSSLKFSPDGQMLAIASRATRDALRFVHVPTFTVFRNWPTSVTPLGRVTSLDFSPSGHMFSTANEQGYARLFSINHYGR